MRYERYRKTGIAWLPEVPEGWEVRRARYLFRKEQRSTRPGDEIVTAFRDGQVTLRKNRRTTGFTEATDYSHYQGICKGDLVIHQMDAFAGCAGVSDSNGMGTPVLSVCTPISNQVDVFYFAHIVRLMGRNGYIQSLARGIRERSADFRFETFARQSLPLPPLPEQQAIAAYLDSKCGKIDRLVAAKEKEVALLKELKQSMIAEAVTRGVDHKSLKVPTGVFWQPRMPIGWSVKKCRHVLQKLSRPRPQDAELLVCTNKGTVNKRGDAKIGLVSDDETIYQGVAAGDLLIHGMDTWHGAIAVSEFDGMCTPVVHVCDSAENKAFVAYCFQNMARGKLFKLISNGVRQNTSDFRSWEKVARLPLVLPSRDEQDRIVAYIEARAAKIDAAVGKLEAEVAALKEYRERLVADVVTGQRKVA